MNETIKNNLLTVKNEIKNQEKLSNRSENSVRLLAVSKYHPKEEIISCIEEGQLHFGENHVQEAYEKFSEIKKLCPDVILHMIGSLQTNKVKKACEIASVIESVDRINLIKEIEKQCARLNKTIDILFEIHTGEDSKSGFENEESLFDAIDYIKDGNASHIKIKGLMTMAPFTDNQELIRKSFSTLKNLQEKLMKRYPEFDFTELSMGMSEDYKIAIQEGSSQVRVGTKIFGARNYNK